MDQAKANTCYECCHIVDDCEYGDYGSTISTHFYCSKKEEATTDDEKFPYDPAPKECFRLEFWHSEFCLELEDGSQEEMDRAYKKFQEWFEKEYSDPTESPSAAEAVNRGPAPSKEG